MSLNSYTMDNENQVVNEEMTNPTVSEDVKTEQETEVIEETSEVAPETQSGDKTDPNLLLKSLQDERERRRSLEDKVTKLEENLEEKSSALSEDEVFSDEGKVLQGDIKTLKSELSDMRSEIAKKDLLIAHPILKDKWNEFNDFRSDSDNKGMNLRTAAKAYLVENGLLDAPRKGLEKSTGGQRVPLTSGMTVDDVRTLRETNFKKYQELLIKGQLNISS